MNMMVNTSDLAVNEAETNKISRDALNGAVSKLVASWERKQAKKLARAGGLGFLAISLAACNSSSDDTATTTTPTTTTPVVTTPAAPTVNNITIAAANTSVFGTAGANDVITATGTTLTGNHIIADSDTTDDDSLTITLTGDYTAAPTVVGIEDVNFTTSATLAGGDTVLTVNVNSITASGDTITFDVTGTDSLISSLVIDNAGTNHYSTSSEFTSVTTASKLDADVVVTIGANATIVDNTGAAADDYTINGGAFNVTVANSLATEDLVVSGKDIDVTFAAIAGSVKADATNNITAVTTAAALGDVTVTAGNDITAVTAAASTGTATLTAGNDITAATLSAAKTITLTAKGAITLTNGTAATTVTVNNTGGTAATDDIVITDANSATTFTGTSVGAITATANTGLHAATSATITAAEASAIDLGANDATINLNADASGITNTPEVVFTITGIGTGNTINLGGVTAVAVGGSTTQFTGQTVLSTNASSAVSITTSGGNVDVSKIATTVPIRFDVDLNNRTFSKVKNEHVFQMDVETAQNGATNAITFTHETDATSTTTHSLTLNVIDSVTATGTDNTLDTHGFVFTDFNTVNIDVGAETINFDADSTGADVDKYVITGSGTIDFNSLNFQGNSATSAPVTELDASGMTGTVTGYTLNGDANIAEIVKTGDGADTITIAAAAASTNAFAITTGAKADTVTYNASQSAAFSFDGGTGTDTLSMAHDASLPSTASLTSVERINIVGDGAAGGVDSTFLASWLTGKTFIIAQTTNDYDLVVTMDQTSVDVSNLTFETAAKTASDLITINAGSVGLPVTVVGSAIADTITGSAGADTITGGEGVDTIRGEDGADIITLTETTAAADIVIIDDDDAMDKITGFKVGSDTLQLSVGSLEAEAPNKVLAGAGGTTSIAGAAVAASVADGAAVTLTNQEITKITDTTGNNSNADLDFTITLANTAGNAADAVMFCWYDADDAAAVFSYIIDSDAAGGTKSYIAGSTNASIVDLAMVYMNTADFTALDLTDDYTGIA